MLSFGSASMLWWGLAAAIPFVLHLWNRKPRQIVPFAATRFLLAATKRQSRRIKFQQWILLIARVGILLLFALALAEPRWGGSATTIQGSVPTHHLLVLDDSYSMQARLDSETRLDDAKARLIEIVRNAPVGDLFSVITMGEPPEVAIAGPSHEREEIERAIHDLEIRPITANIAQALSLGKRMIDDSQSIGGGPKAYRVTFASDLARNTWRNVNPEQVDAELASAASGVSWSLILPSDSPLQNNLAISQFRTNQSVAYLDQSISGSIELANTGTKDCEGAMLEIRAGERVLFRYELSLKAGERVSRPWRIEPQRESLMLEVRVDADDLEIDNRRFLAIELRSAPRVLCLASSTEAAEHFMLALTAGQAKSRPKVDLVEAASWESTNLLARFSDYDAIVLLNFPPPTGDVALALKKFAEEGGGVLIGLGDRAVTGNAALQATPDFYPATIGSVVKVETPRFDALDFQHPLLAEFRDAPEVGLLSLPVWRYFKLEAIRPTAKVAARFGSGDPALLEEAVGRGRMVLFASSLGAESIDKSESPAMPWSGLPGSAAYVPLIQEWVARVAASQPLPSLEIGDSVSRVGADQSRLIEFRSDSNWTQLPIATRTLARPGFYRISGASNKPPVAVNLDVEESWYDSDRARWTSWIHTKQPERAGVTIGNQPVPRSLSAWLLIPLCLLACGEIVLATLLRRGRTSISGNVRSAA